MDKLICVGKNYLKHAVELGDAVPEEAIYFLKPPSTLCTVTGDGQTVALPTRGEVHHEVELVFRLSGKGASWSALEYTVGLDLTLRDVQSRMKKAGQPWEKAKVFENAAIVGPWQKVDRLADLMEQPFRLHVNGELRQEGFGREMRFGVEALLADLPRWFPICDGDLLFTGTPEGVAALRAGDRVQVEMGPIKYSFICSSGG